MITMCGDFKMKGRICAVICAIMIVALFVGLCIYEQHKTKTAYLEAVECLKDGKYDMAMRLLEKANKKNFDETDFSYSYYFANNASKYYKNTAVLYVYAKARALRRQGENAKAVYAYLDDIPENYEGEQSGVILAFKRRSYDEYMAYLEAERIRKEKEELERARSSVPYVGMSEKLINDTILGTNYEIVHNSEYEYGKKLQANVYRFKKGNAIIFVARCLKGKVDSVSDYRDDPWILKTYTGTKKRSEKDDPYNVNDYSDPEDFYDDNYDDFWDYEDAEDYYNEHHE